MRSILAHYLERFGKDNTRSACKYAHHLYVAAKYWVHAPPEQLAELHRWRRNLNPPRLA